MDYNRKLWISTAGTRKATYWPKNEIMWSDFVDRLKNPVRSSETMEEYLALGKSQQAELKDVGGFVGGPLSMTGERALMYKEGIF